MLFPTENQKELSKPSTTKETCAKQLSGARISLDENVLTLFKTVNDHCISESLPVPKLESLLTHLKGYCFKEYTGKRRRDFNKKTQTLITGSSARLRKKSLHMRNSRSHGSLIG